MVLDDKAYAEVFECIGLFSKGPARQANMLAQGEMAMLASIVFGAGETTPGELSENLELTTARVANTLNSLEDKGLVERIHDKVDRRRVFVRITEKGRKAVEKAQKEAAEELNLFLEALGEEDAKEYIRLMRKMRKLMLEKREHDKAQKTI